MKMIDLEDLIIELQKYPKDLFVYVPNTMEGSILGGFEYCISDNGTPYLMAKSVDEQEDENQPDEKECLRTRREQNEGWIFDRVNKKLLMLTPHEVLLISHLLSEEQERMKGKKSSIQDKNFLSSTKGHILNGGEKC